jgi:hypothetical protein
MVNRRELFHVERLHETRTCLLCNRERPLVLFAKNVIEPCCQLCYDTNRQKTQLSWQERRQRMMEPSVAPPIQLVKRADRLWHAARLRAWRNELPFDLTKDWVIERLEMGKCEITGIEFDAGTNGSRTFSPSVERRNPELGYVAGNCLVVVWIYNSAKGPGTHEDVVRLARALVAAEDKRLAAARQAMAEKDNVGRDAA